MGEWSPRDQKIRHLARGYGPMKPCPTCGRVVEVVRGYWTQHSDPRSWGSRLVEQCANELEPYRQKEPT